MSWQASYNARLQTSRVLQPRQTAASSRAAGAAAITGRCTLLPAFAGCVNGPARVPGSDGWIQCYDAMPHAGAFVAANHEIRCLVSAFRRGCLGGRRAWTRCCSAFSLFGDPDSHPQGDTSGLKFTTAGATGSKGDQLAFVARTQLARRQYMDFSSMLFDFDENYLDLSKQNAGVSLGLLKQLFVQLRCGDSWHSWVRRACCAASCT